MVVIIGGWKISGKLIIGRGVEIKGRMEMMFCFGIPMGFSFQRF